MNAVLDTNILVSRFIVPHGNAAQIVRFWEEGTFQLLISEPILVECARILGSPRIRRKYSFTGEELDHYITSLRENANLVQPTVTLDAVKADPDDNAIVECAIAGDADYIITGDMHLLNLGSYGDIQIIRPATFLFLLAEAQVE